MLNLLRQFVKSIPTLVLSFALAVAVWISAVSAADPVSQQQYPRPITIERMNQDPSLVISSQLPPPAKVILSAPSSVWDTMLTDLNPIRVWIDLAGLGPGTYTVPVNVQPLHQPARVVSWQPRDVEVTLERLVTKDFPIHLIIRGDPAIGFLAGTPTLDPDHVTVSGPESIMNQVKDAQVLLDQSQATDTINRILDVNVLNASGAPVEGISTTPSQVTVHLPVTRIAGVRNVVVKVITTGQPAVGYRLTNISVSPPTVQISGDPNLVESLPGYIETSPVDLTGVKDDVERPVPLNLPKNVSVTGDQLVTVQVGVAAIEDSVTLSGLPVRVANLPQGMISKLSPTTVDVIVSGPVLLLDKLTPEDVTVVVDLTNVVPGTYQLVPKVTIDISELRSESILPGSIEVVVEPEPTPTPTVTPSPTPTPSATPSPTRAH